MKLFGFEIGRVKSRARYRKSAYQAAMASRLTSDWPTAILSADAALKWNLPQLRSRSRDLERNGGILERFLSASEANVIGSAGIGLQMKIRKGDARTVSGIRSDFDEAANQLIEYEWCEFGRRGNFDVTGKHSREDFQRLALRTVARDGDAIVLIYRGGIVPTRWKIAYQLLEGDYLDDQFDVERGYTGSKIPVGHTVRMGVELDGFKRKVAYWIFAKHPGDYGTEGVYVYDGRRLRIPALGTEPSAPVHALHLTRCKRAEETRGVPWVTPAMMAIKMLEGYEEAELVAARTQACKAVFFEREQFAPDGSPLDYGQEDPNTGQLVEDIEPGAATELPIGYKANFYNPTHPTTAYPEYTKSVKRKISAALNCAYTTLFVDLESVNYSSIRAGLLDEREEWKMKQSWFRDDFVVPSFETWMQFQLMIGTFGSYGLTDFQRLNMPEWKFRRWPWVDPEKDVKSAIEAIEAKITTRSRVISDQSSEDFEDTIDEWAREQKYIEDRELDPLLHEPKRSGQLIDSADLPNDPNADATELEPANPKSAKANAQNRAAGGQFAKGYKDESGSQESMSPEQIKTLVSEAVGKAAPNVTVNVPPPVISIENLNLPEQKAPEVTVNTPAVTVNVPEMVVPPAEVTVNVPAPEVRVENTVNVPTTSKLRVLRDSEDKISEVTVEKE